MNNTHLSDTSHLKIPLRAPFSQFSELLGKQSEAVEAWFKEQFSLTPAPFYASVDLRHAGFKLAPIDTNLFPAGFNNLAETTYPDVIAAIQKTLGHIGSAISRVLVMVESSAKNPMYFENVATLQHVLQLAGLAVRVGVISDQLKVARTIQTPSGREVRIEPFSLEKTELKLDDFEPDLVLLNQDLSEGIPAVLSSLKTPIMPPPQLGWALRLKSAHFQHVNNVTAEFGHQFEIDPWAVSPLFRYCGEINFQTREGEDCLVRHAETVLSAIQDKYREYGITEEPYLVIKADAGTFGMAVMTIKTPADIRSLNRKQRQRMSTSKGGQSVTRAIIQEGVHTLETWGDAQSSAEPVIYMVGDEVVGGFYRIHSAKGADQILNTAGMEFSPMGCEVHRDEDAIRCYSYSVVARLALLAAARERKEILDDH